MNGRLKVAFLVVVVLWAVASAGCGPTTQTVPFPTTAVEHNHDKGKPVMTVDEILGPPGAKSGNILPGVYVVRGRYDLTGTSHKWGTIFFDISPGKYQIWLPNDGKGITDAEIDAASQPHFAIPEGQPKGAFEVTIRIKEVTDGKGSPHLTYAPHQRPGGDITVHESIYFK